jgi:hypothetical protein
MSIWSDIEDRSSGEVHREEEIAQIYYIPEEENSLLEEKKYKDFLYKISTNGYCPTLTIQTQTNISCFSGCGLIYLKIDGKEYPIERNVNFGMTKFIYKFDKEGDYTYGDKDESKQKYTLNNVEAYAEMFINEIIQTEYEFVKNMDKS